MTAAGKAVRCRIDHTAAGEEAIELRAPRGQLEAWEVSDVASVIAEAEAAARRGIYAVGFVAYEAAPAFDKAFRVKTVAQHDQAMPSLPLAWFGLFAESRAVKLPCPTWPGTAPIDDTSPSGPPSWTCDIDAPAHATDVGSIRKAIADGDAYLVNHTSRFRRPWAEADDPFGLYCQLVTGHNGGYHAYIETTDWAVACGSPELFFELSSGHLTSRPMKGTTPRGRWSDEDAERASALSGSTKERAENVMVVDMLRNDMGRIAVTGSVAVPHLWELERHPTLWQLTSTVTATARDEVGLVDIFGALFPCASVTGAPKVSAMAIISDLERSPRGVYCGAVGIIRPDPSRHSKPNGVSARFAVGIRTAVVDKERRQAEYGSGGGITWDSLPESEWDEVLVKTKAVVGGTPSPGPAHGLIETMGFDPLVNGGAVRNLGDHLARLASSADYFGFPKPVDAGRHVADAIARLTVPSRVRLVLRPDGSLEVTTSSFPDNDDQPTIQRLCVDRVPVQSTNFALFHKTTDRRGYEERARRHHGDDVVLTNERGEVTETTRANLAVYVDGQWGTPPLDCGLLPGIERARLLATGQLVERVMTVDDLRNAEAVATLSSLRGWRRAQICADCSCGIRP
jgi:para-aminobenzoate synthetase / 4-amino-4-deoxychorismate lyase